MYCSSCNVLIPSEWKNVILKNICPNCEGEIVNAEMKELMDGLRTAILQMNGNIDGVIVWLLGNYRLTKIGTEQPVIKFIGEKQTSAATTNQEGSIKIRENPLQKFLKNAGVPVKTKAEMIAAINGEEPPERGDEPIEETEDPEYTKAVLDSMMNGSTTSKGGRSPVREEIANVFGQEDVSKMDLPPALQADRFRRLQTQQELQSGGVGKIKRAK